MNTATPSRVTPLRDLGDIRPPPASIEAEQCLIGGICINNAAYHQVAEFLAPEHFSLPVHQRLFEAIGKLIEGGSVADPITLGPLFEHDEALRTAGGVQYLAKLVEGAVTVINSASYGRQILEMAMRRELIAIGQEIVANAFTQSLDDEATAQIDRASERLFALSSVDPSNLKRSVSASDAVTASLEATQRAYRDEGRKVAGLSSGIEALDRIVGGFAGGDFDVIGGATSMGKSSMALTLAIAALDDRVPVHIFSGEMRAPQLASRLLAAVSGVSSGRQRRGILSHAEWGDLTAAQQRIASWPLTIDDGQMLLPRMMQQAHMIARRNKVGMFIVDHLQLVHLDNDSEMPRFAEVERITNSLKRLAIDLDVPVIGLSQLSRKIEERDNKRPMLSDLRNSSSLEQDADAVILLFRNEVYLKDAAPTQLARESDVDFQGRYAKWQDALERSRGQADCICPKVRHDEPGTAHVRFDGERSLFYDERQGGSPLL